MVLSDPADSRRPAPAVGRTRALVDDGPAATWITSSSGGLAPVHGGYDGTGRPVRTAPLPGAPTDPISLPPPPPASPGALGSGHTSLDLSQQFGRSYFWAVIAAGASAAAAMTGRRRVSLVFATPFGVSGARPPFTPD
jgi:hypothetical protein